MTRNPSNVFRLAVGLYYREILFTVGISLLIRLIALLYLGTYSVDDAVVVTAVFSYPMIDEAPSVIILLLNLFYLLPSLLLVAWLWEINEKEDVSLLAIRIGDPARIVSFQAMIPLLASFLITFFSTLLFAIAFAIPLAILLRFFIYHAISLFMLSFVAKIINTVLSVSLLSAGLLCFFINYFILLIPNQAVRIFSLLYPLYLLADQGTDPWFYLLLTIQLLITTLILLRQYKVRNYLGGDHNVH